MYCLLCKKHGVKTSQNKDETAFTHTHTPSLRMKSDALKAHCNSERHTKAISQELLQRMSSFHKEMAERRYREMC